MPMAACRARSCAAIGRILWPGMLCVRSCSIQKADEVTGECRHAPDWQEIAVTALNSHSNTSFKSSTWRSSVGKRSARLPRSVCSVWDPCTVRAAATMTLAILAVHTSNKKAAATTSHTFIQNSTCHPKTKLPLLPRDCERTMEPSWNTDRPKRAFECPPSHLPPCN